jgi:multiple sugar transport system ATP-binding protein
VPGVSFRNVWKIYDDGTVAVRDLSLDVADGELMVFVGPSGCGKTTALRTVAGLEEITAGDLFIGERRVNGLSPKQRNVAMVFQNYALYPHMTVRENMALALKISGVRKQERRRRVEEVAAILGLSELLDRKPAKLSGGQRQRVAMGRAIVRDPSVFLLDEPLSNLDAKLRVQMRAEIAELQARLSATTIFVTHDQVEAMTMAHRVAVMRGGLLQQVGPPQELYHRPTNLFVAEFIGSPAMNLLAGTVENGAGGLSVRYGGEGQRIALDGEGAARLSARVGGEVIVGIRPEHLALARGADARSRIDARVRLVEPLGGETIVYAAVDVPPVVTDETREVQRDVDEIAVEAQARESRFAVRLPGDEAPAPDERVALAVDGRRLHFFDPETGEALA